MGTHLLVVFRLAVGAAVEFGTFCDWIDPVLGAVVVDADLAVRVNTFACGGDAACCKDQSGEDEMK